MPPTAEELASYQRVFGAPMPGYGASPLAARSPGPSIINGNGGMPSSGGAQTSLGVPGWLPPVAGWIAGQLLGEGGNGYSSEEAFLDYFGLGIYGREGAVAATRTTPGTGMMSAGTFRAWDPVQQGYYGILPIQGQYAQGITLAPGNLVPSGGVITKAWLGHSLRKDDSMATTQFAMTSDGWMHSLSESGVPKHWKPYKSIVIGKSLTSSNVRRVARRIKSHTKSLKKVLSCLK